MKNKVWLTIEVTRAFKHRLKVAAAVQGKTITAIVLEALEDKLAQFEAEENSPESKLPIAS
ncbi:hypothetical protein [Leptolyngbya ohadii]|uniref:hypothetical protein n=1 Tax=Leptolyngbya ohadii TaxID=1962290 RepID=UPI000B5A114F|nr:hypothetical protein [Leptolyngbya ohadii]